MICQNKTRSFRALEFRTPTTEVITTANQKTDNYHWELLRPGGTKKVNCLKSGKTLVTRRHRF